MVSGSKTSEMLGGYLGAKMLAASTNLCIA